MSLRKRLVLLYFLVGLEGVAFVEFQNLFVLGKSWGYILKYNLPVVLLQNAIFIIVYYFFTVRRLRDAILLDKYPEKLATLTSEEKTKLFHKIVSFPMVMFRFSIMFMVSLAIAFHIYVAFLLDEITKKVLVNMFFSFLREQSIGMIITLTIIAFLGKALRPTIIKLNQPSISFIHVSLVKKIVLVFFSLLFIFLTDLVWLFLSVQAPVEVIIYKVIVVIAVLLVLSILSIKLIIMDSLKYTHEVANYIAAASIGKRETLHTQIPVTSGDEIGYLVGSFNELQQRIGDLYKEIDDELRLALKIQEKLVPQTSLQFGDYQITGLSLPVKETGGDFFDVIKFNDNKLVLLIGDVSGKGLPAALFMSMMIGIVRIKINNNSLLMSPADMLDEINVMLKPMLNEGMYISAGIGVIDLETRMLTYASAGHVSPIIRESGITRTIDQSSFPLGIDDNEQYSEVVLPLDPLEAILLYTDGMIEQHNTENSMYGFDRLISSFKENWDKDGKLFLDNINDFSTGKDREDDMTVVHLKRYNWNTR
ncbi:PP2C family protein-serine/threonine phosphatase [Schinkia azotoformans]|uniref:PP2C family protein-serine/threonine phosphatase n=1 Tax=Schinkia azotoformans TaxID=1454 RepID=UPI002DBA3E15|nr:SpoIIE family protein phosphatase [Schinkia azotoformans]MEC1695612.1 SpoIIE family protein phosphatase [Schinkia azotoformans]MEC1726569.1 SpoIIE family protein phosphatase [Schinkia azotoformans]MEC1782147.1 SpoIIE family protein phosphatase [Schinkia azotoformans]MED4331875.1 SpoIIE family protein phosphatase [Schinkia azotoformans]